MLKVREGALLHFQLQKSALKVQKSLILHFKDGISNDKLLRLEVTDGRGPVQPGSTYPRCGQRALPIARARHNGR